MKNQIRIFSVLLLVAVLVGVITIGLWSKHDESGLAHPPLTHPEINSIKCEEMEGSGIHIHAHLTIINNGRKVPISDNIGIEQHPSCYYWLHTHDRSGKIHIESPIKRTFTLGEFFDIWHQSLSNTQVASYSDGKDILIYIDNQIYKGDPRKIELAAHQQIVLEVGPTFVKPPTPFEFPPGD